MQMSQSFTIVRFRLGVERCFETSLPVAMVSSAPGDLEVAMSGTSMASPFIAGLSARVFEINPKLTASQVKKLLAKAVTLVPSLTEKTSAGGVVNKESLFSLAEKTNSESFETVMSSTIESKTNGQKFFENIFKTSPMDTNTFSVEDASLVHRTSEIVKRLIRRM